MKYRIITHRGEKKFSMRILGGKTWFAEAKPNLTEATFDTQGAEAKLTELQEAPHLLFLHPRKAKPEDCHPEFVLPADVELKLERV